MSTANSQDTATSESLVVDTEERKKDQNDEQVPLNEEESRSPSLEDATHQRATEPEIVEHETEVTTTNENGDSAVKVNEYQENGENVSEGREENGDEDIGYTTPTGRMPRQWLIDRCDGTSKYNPEKRPPCFPCWVPMPVKWFPDYLEQNCCCEKVGRIGCIDPENTRARLGLFSTAFVINVIGLSCLVVASFAIADESFTILWNVSFTNIWLQLIEGPQNYETTPTFVGLGLRAAAVESLFQKPEETGVLSFSQFCDRIVEDQVQSSRLDATMSVFVSGYQENYDCDSCQKISKKIVPSLFLSMLSYIPNFTTDILRIYSNYDVNCQKFVGSIFSWISLGTAIYTWVNYRKGCFDSLDTEPFGLNENLEKVELDDEDLFVVVRFQWRAAIGQICLAVATFLKLVDIVINCILPTPTITRDHLEQVEYEWKFGKHNCSSTEETRDEDNAVSSQSMEREGNTTNMPEEAEQKDVVETDANIP